MTLTATVESLIRKPAICLATALIAASCYTMPRDNDDVQTDRTFIGRPFYMENKDNDLRFVMKGYDEESGKLFKLTVHEEADNSNVKNIEMVEQWVREAADNPSLEIKVQGEYTPKYSIADYEEGIIDPYIVIKMSQNDSLGTFEEAAWTDSKKSDIYTEKHAHIILTRVYAPGIHFRIMYYPFFDICPYWDIDCDGIPNTWDPWPTISGSWPDRNFNGIPDWYDPFLRGPYWNDWHHHYKHHRDFFFRWENYYKKDFKSNKDFRERGKDIIRLRNNLGGRNLGFIVPQRNPGDIHPPKNINGERERNNAIDNEIKNNDTKTRDNTNIEKRVRDNKNTNNRTLEHKTGREETTPPKKNSNTQRQRDDYKKNDDTQRETYKNNQDIQRDMYKNSEKQRDIYQRNDTQQKDTRRIETQRNETRRIEIQRDDNRITAPQNIPRRETQSTDNNRQQPRQNNTKQNTSRDNTQRER